MEEQYENIFCWAGTVIMLAFFLGSILPFAQIIKGKKNYEDTPIIFVFGSYINYLLWFVYAKMINNEHIVYYHGIGCSFSILSFVIYIIYEAREFLVDAILNFLLLVTGTFAVYRALDVLVDDEDIVGKICVSSSAIVVITPIYFIYRDYRNNPGFLNNKFLVSNYLALVSIVGSCCWAMYGYMNVDEYILKANVISAISYFSQILLWLVLKKLSKKNIKVEPVPTVETENDSREENYDLK